MSEINEAGFDGSVDVGKGYKIIFRRGDDLTQLKEKLEKQPFNQFFWLRNDKMLLFRNKEGEFFKMNFEKIEL